MIKQTYTKKTKIISSLLFAVFFSGALLIGIISPSFVNANNLQEQINQLRDENEKKKEQVGALQVEAGSIQETINKLQQQINGLQAQIAENNEKNAKLAKDIEEAQKELDKQKDLLGQNIKAMYLEGDISTIEMLASSKDLSDFVDKEQYRNAVKSKIKTSLDKVTELKALLRKQKEDVEKLIREQQSLKNQIASQQSEQNRLLGMNQAEQNQVNEDIKANKSRIDELVRQQIVENMRIFGSNVTPGIPGGGGYPWGNAYCVYTNSVDGPCFNYDWYFNGSAWDSWGYGFRNCTSWVAYKLAADGKVGFTYLGNAKNWPANAAARGVAVSYGSGARVGDAAVNPNGYYGHVMYVEAVNGDGTVLISDYNRMGDGLYRQAVVSQSSLVFVHF